MLTREELTSEKIDQIVADAHKAGYHFFLSSKEREASLKAAMSCCQPGEEVWVFAYGSLMWNPALEFAETQPCKVDGWRRSFCFWTPELPGLMLALERGGACEGIAYRLAPDQVQSELAILWNREMLSGVYQAHWVPTKLRDGRTVTAVTFVVDTAHCQYCGDLPIERAVPVATISPTPRRMHAPCTFTIRISRNWSIGSRHCGTTDTSSRSCSPTARRSARLRGSAYRKDRRRACGIAVVMT